jgi:hypothetical protein
MVECDGRAAVTVSLWAGHAWGYLLTRLWRRVAILLVIVIVFMMRLIDCEWDGHGVGMAWHIW